MMFACKILHAHQSWLKWETFVDYTRRVKSNMCGETKVNEVVRVFIVSERFHSLVTIKVTVCFKKLCL